MQKRLVIVLGLLLMVLISTSPAKAVTSASCEVQAVTAYGTPAAGIQVTLSLFNIDPGSGEPYPGVSSTGWTDASGRVMLSGSPREFANCDTTTPGSGHVAYGGELSLWGSRYDATLTLSGTLVVLPKPSATIQFPGGGTADLYGSGEYDKPVVVAQPFFSDEPVKGRMSADDLWTLYNGDPRLLDGGMLVRLFRRGYDVWLVRPRLVGDDLTLQAANYAQAVQSAAGFHGYESKVSVAGFSMGGLVVRIAMAKWSSYGLSSPTPPINLIATLDSPLRGALVSNDLQHAFWNATSDNGKSAHERNMDSCAAQQMLENACHKTVGCADCLECNDRGWYETFYGGNSFTFCNPWQGHCYPTTPPYPYPSNYPSGLRTCFGVALLNLPNGGWPAGIRKIAASLGKFGERTGICYGDTTVFDKTGTGRDGCPARDFDTFGTGEKWGYLDISFSTDRKFYYRSLNPSSDSWRQHWIDELTPGSRQPGSVEDVAGFLLGFRILNGHQILHAGTFIPLYSALDIEPSTGFIPFDEYWTHSYSAFHDALTERQGTWVNQRDGSSGVLPLVPWLIMNLDSAFSPPVCGNGSCERGENTSNCCADCARCGNGQCEASCGESPWTCSIDCPVCGNGLCENREDVLSCPNDCPVVCGDSVCSPGEDFFNCQNDCVICGDSVCSPGEDSFSCPDDCGDGSACGNFACEAGEDEFNCPSDCCVPGECQ